MSYDYSHSWSALLCKTMSVCLSSQRNPQRQETISSFSKDEISQSVSVPHYRAASVVSIDIMKVNSPTTLRQLIITILVGLQATIVRLVRWKKNHELSPKDVAIVLTNMFLQQILVLQRRPLAPTRKIIKIWALVLPLAAAGDVLPGGEVLRLHRRPGRRDQLGEWISARHQKDRQD